MIIKPGDALDLILSETQAPDLVVTDPPYAFGGGGGPEHAITATVAVVLRETALRLKKGRWMLVMSASSWRSTSYMVESVRGIMDPIRTATWCKPEAKTRVTTDGWKWASVNVIAMRKGKSTTDCPALDLDHITAAPIVNGRRAELPPEVAMWMVKPFATPGGVLLDPFAGTGAILLAGERCGMTGIGYEKYPAEPKDRELFEGT